MECTNSFLPIRIAEKWSGYVPLAFTLAWTGATLCLFILCISYRISRFIGDPNIWRIGEVIVVGVTLIWRKAVAVIHTIAMKLYWHHLNLADGRKIAKPPNILRIWY